MAGCDNCQLSCVAMDEDDNCLFVCTIGDGSIANFLPITEQYCGDMLHNCKHTNKANVRIMLENVVFSSQSVVMECTISCYFQIYTWHIKSC